MEIIQFGVFAIGMLLFAWTFGLRGARPLGK